MLQQFTWQQFLTTAAILSAAWYAAVLFLYFRTEIQGLLSGSRPQRPDTEPSPPVTDDGDDSPMGRPAEPEGVESVGPDELSFAPAREPDGAARTRRLGVVSDVMHELKNMVMLLRQENGTKEEFHALFGHIKQTYPTIRESGQLAALTSYLEDYLPFALTEEEKGKLWD
ncbi:hypothetical protein GCM10011386_26880 [Parapedobacter defluvii]|uniref:Uncharacterized protein n=1 Tax=Parapedobacter defluvii TaxID=2045106 RepID=A0ABQ1M4A0_9SPHI|nr:hypothetical protein [Parapedobacter defluvii]GGC33416.1 hypothetical protein GCM10011386_26880 [Parapedobacter defluvii]